MLQYCIFILHPLIRIFITEIIQVSMHTLLLKYSDNYFTGISIQGKYSDCAMGMHTFLSKYSDDLTVNHSNAEATFGQSTKMQRLLKII